MFVSGDEEARNRGTQKSVLERKAPPTFPLVIEMRERAMWVTHWVEDSVDCLLHNKAPVVQVTHVSDAMQVHKVWAWIGFLLFLHNSSVCNKAVAVCEQNDSYTFSPAHHVTSCRC